MDVVLSSLSSPVDVLSLAFSVEVLLRADLQRTVPASRALGRPSALLTSGETDILLSTTTFVTAVLKAFGFLNAAAARVASVACVLEVGVAV